MPSYHRFELPKATVILTSGELIGLLCRDTELYKRALGRGKAIKRCEGKQVQYEKKFASQESQTLNNLVQ